jgi:hypothetical protein
VLDVLTYSFLDFICVCVCVCVFICLLLVKEDGGSVPFALSVME